MKNQQSPTPEETVLEAEPTTADEPAQAEVVEEARLVVPQHEIDAVIRKRVYASMALGLAPLPLVDMAGLFAIQLELVNALAKSHGLPFRPDLAKASLTALLGSFLPVSTGPMVASLLKFIPIIGMTTSAVTMSLSGGASTYAVGQIFAKHFTTGGSLVDFKVDKVRQAFKDKYEEGKSVIKSFKGGKKEAEAAA